MNLENQEKLTAFSLLSYKIYYAYTNDIITKDNIDTLKLNEYKESKYFEILNPDNQKYFIFIPMNEIEEQTNKVIFVNNIFFEENNTYTIEAKKNALILLNNEDMNYTNINDFIDYFF